MKTWIKSLLMFGLFFMAQAISLAGEDMDTLIARFPELKVMQTDNLPVRVARENWDQARQRVATDNSWKAWLKSTQTSLDVWMSRPRDQADWISGYPHDLIDPVTNLPLKWSPEMPKQPPTTTAARKLHEAWVARARESNFEKLLEASRMYRLTDDRRYAEWAAGQIDFYADNYCPLALTAAIRKQIKNDGTGA